MGNPVNPFHTTFRKPRHNPQQSEMPFFQPTFDLKGANTSQTEMLGFRTNSNFLPGPKRLREKFNYAALEDIPIWVETPDIHDFANELIRLRNREELV